MANRNQPPFTPEQARAVSKKGPSTDREAGRSGKGKGSRKLHKRVGFTRSNDEKGGKHRY